MKEDAKSMTFLTRHGTNTGILAHLFCSLNAQDHRNWTSLIEKQIHAAVCVIKNAEFTCKWHNRDCKLLLNYEQGFKLFDLKQNSVLWQQGFEKLKSSADNGQNLLWLNFENEEGEIVRI